nr:acetyltransferase [Rheinheimera faecalis]
MGASGHGKVVAEIALATGHWQQVVFYDDAWPQKLHNGQFQIVGDTQRLLALEHKPEVAVGIGNNQIRLHKQAELISAGFAVATVIHPTAVVSATAKISAGTVIMPGAIINADVHIATGCIINSNAVVEHDCVLADGCHVSPGAALAGGVHLGEGAWIGIGASVIQQKKIGQYVMVGAGAAVVSDLPDNVTAVGVPAKIIK